MQSSPASSGGSVFTPSSHHHHHQHHLCISHMLSLLKSRLRRLCSRLPWPRRRHRNLSRRSTPNIVIKPSHPAKSLNGPTIRFSPSPDRSVRRHPGKDRPIRIATFNAAFFSMAPVIARPERSTSFDFDHLHHHQPQELVKAPNFRAKSANDRPKSILKHSPLHLSSVNGESDGTATKQQKFARSKLRVSINLPDNEISLLRNRQLGFEGHERHSSGGRKSKGKAPMRYSASFCGTGIDGVSNGYLYHHRVGAAATTTVGSGRTMAEVLREVDADIVALQDVKAEEESEMRPLSDLAKALGMNYVFAESWAPEYGNAVLSRWPIRRWKVHKIFDDTDFRNVLKATIDVPEAGEVNFHCTLLDHLDENWRKKQIDSILRFSDEVPHILSGCLNSLDESDYSNNRWTDIVKYYEELGKPTPKAEVMRFLKSNRYTDAKDFAGECEPVVVIAKGQSVQGTCKYGTRVDYILASPDSPYKFVPGSYSVLSSKGTSDHHIVKVDVVKSTTSSVVQEDNGLKKRRQQRRKQPQKVVKINGTSPSNGIWRRRATTDHNKQRGSTFDS